MGPCGPPCRIRLEAQDAALSRRRSPVRIRYAVPTEIPDAPGPRPGGVTFSATMRDDDMRRPATATRHGDQATTHTQPADRAISPGGPMEPTAPRRLVILTEGEFGPHHAKTAWGVIRYGRDEIVAILDSTIAGRNVDEWLPGHDIPAVATLGEALAIPGRPRPNALLIGIAPTGGRLPDEWRTVLLEAIREGLE